MAKNKNKFTLGSTSSTINSRKLHMEILEGLLEELVVELDNSVNSDIYVLAGRYFAAIRSASMFFLELDDNVDLDINTLATMYLSVVHSASILMVAMAEMAATHISEEHGSARVRKIINVTKEYILNITEYFILFKKNNICCDDDSRLN